MPRNAFLPVLMAVCPPAIAQSTWPEIALPEHATSYSIGPQMDMNGLPMRLTGFASLQSPRQTADWFVRTLGQPLMDNRLGGQRILGRAQGEHYITVRIEPGPDGHGTRGLVAVTHLRAALRNQTRSQQERQQWQNMLPAGTEITSLLHARDGGRLSTHLIATNRHSEPLNAQRLTQALQAQGYVLESSLAGTADIPGTSLVLRGPGKEAMAVITRDAHGLTRIVATTSVAQQEAP